MNNRELFLEIMHYRKVERVPVMHWRIWTETRARWIREGMPEEMPEAEYLGASPIMYNVKVKPGLYPPFEEETVEETDEYRVFRQHDGVIAKRWKNRSSVPNYLNFTIKGTDGTGWGEYKRRLQPDAGRIPEDFEEIISAAANAEVPVSVSTGSLIGWIRNWVGVENLAYITYDNRELLKEMTDTITRVILWCLDQVLPRVKVDIGWGWEDICFRSGPLINPEIFKEVCVPNYQRIAQKLYSHGVDLYLVDCDGFIDSLIPYWLEGGVNVMFPFEVGVWQADPADYLKRYGRNLRIFGGIDKRQLAKGRKAIDAEIDAKFPLMKQGGFVPLPDHLIPPDVSLEDYRYYLSRLKKIKLSG